MENFVVYIGFKLSDIKASDDMENLRKSLLSTLNVLGFSNNKAHFFRKFTRNLKERMFRGEIKHQEFEE